MRTNTKHSTVTFLADGGYSSVWNYGEGVIKITQDMTTIDFYDAILHTERVKGLPEVTEVAPNLLQALIFDIKSDECSTHGESLDVTYKFTKDSSLLQDFKGYTMPKYNPLITAMRKIIWDVWYTETKKHGIILASVACNEELELAFSVFRTVVPAEAYYPASLELIEDYLKKRDNWCLDPGIDNFLMDTNGKLIFADVFSGIIDFVYCGADTTE